ncbi:MAG: hypothetical protein H6515_12995 [Microthrixaceae bacterium]|nr:hypothetical protein [Microthrixaceae bacterium]
MPAVDTAPQPLDDDQAATVLADAWNEATGRWMSPRRAEALVAELVARGLLLCVCTDPEVLSMPPPWMTRDRWDDMRSRCATMDIEANRGTR